jgi:hypothetical protein
MTTTLHKAGGSRGGNQYGEYQVRYASEKQINFIKKLLNEKQHACKLTDEELTKLNVQGAGDLITSLLSCPTKPDYVEYATDKQVAYAQSLVDTKEGGLEAYLYVLQKNKVRELKYFTRKEVSELINTLRTKATKEPTMQITEVGAYLYEGVIYSIRLGVESKKWQVWSYSDEQKKYVRDDSKKNILPLITPAHRLTLRDAIKYSAQTGRCCHCGRTLTKAKSIAGGMGAICAKKYGY